MTVAALATRIEQAQGRRALLHEQAKRAREALQAAEAETQAADVALGLIHAVRDETTAHVQQTISALASEALQLVFEDAAVILEVRSVERRGVVEADLVLKRGALETDPLDGNGGGLVAEAAAMLRLVLVRLLASRGLAPLLVLDEPFAALSVDKRARMADVLHQVAADLGVQILLVSHDEEFVRGSVYRVQRATGGYAEVVRLDDEGVAAEEPGAA